MSSTLILNADGLPLGLLPISSLHYRKAVQRMWAGEASVLHLYDDWFLRSPRLTLQVPAVMIMKEYKKAKTLVRFNRTNVFLRDRYTCQYCLKVFPRHELTYDHVIPQSKGGPTNWTNIVSACGRCNGARGCNVKIVPATMPYRPTYWEMVDKAKRHPIQVPHVSWTYYLDWSPELVTVTSR